MLEAQNLIRRNSLPRNEQFFCYRLDALQSFSGSPD
jgi:hypothetical protein